MNKTAVAQQTKTTSFLPPSQGILQRRCACGNHILAGKECSECSKEGGTSLQRSAVINQPMNGVSLIAPRVQQSDLDVIRVGKSNEIRSLSSVYKGKPNLIPSALHAGGGNLSSPCTKCVDEEGLQTSPPPGGGIVDPLVEVEKQALKSWIVGGKEASMTNNKMRGNNDLLRSWVVGGAATPGINTIKCDGSGGIVVQVEGTGNAAQTACLKDCIIRHEESHRADALAANASICDGVTAGNIVTVNTAAERKATEVKASNVEINCLKAKPETKACKTIIANRITQMIAYRDSF